MNRLLIRGEKMLKPAAEKENLEEIFFTDELYCNFCADMNSKANISSGNASTVPPCNKCTGLIYAIKSKVYFVVN